MCFRLVGFREAKTNLSAFVDEAQHQRILITRRGRPAALLIGVEGQDLEQVLLANDVEFWKMIEQRRQHGATLSSDDVRRHFGVGVAGKQETKQNPRRPRTGRRKGGSDRKK